MKKILVLLMIFVMSFSMISCGGSDDSTDPNAGDDGALTDDIDGEGDLDSEDSEEMLDTSDLIVNDDTMGQYDFGFKVSSSFDMSGAVKKIDYSDLSAQQSKLEEMMETAVKGALSGKYSMFSDYEDEDIDSIDELIYVIAMEDDDSENSFLETGAYHSTDDDKYYQYTVYTSDNYYDDSSSSIAEALSEIKSAYGVTVSQSTVQKAVKKVLEIAQETEDYYSLYETQNVKGDGYTERVTFGVEAFVTEENEVGYYISVERERCYS